MLKTEASGDKTLRSASPHRNAYRAEFQALKKAFDKPHTDRDSMPKDLERKQPRGRQYGAHVSRLKDMFMQMGSENTVAKARGQDESSPQKMVKPTNFINKTDGSVVKLQHSSYTERLGAAVNKFSETRRRFEQQSQDQSQSPVFSYGRDKRGSHDHLDDWRGARSNRGSQDSLDSLCSRTEASSPTVSQLSAVFENRSQVASYRGISRRALYSPDRFQRQAGDLSEDDSRISPVRETYRNRVSGKLPSSVSSEELLSHSLAAEASQEVQAKNKSDQAGDALNRKEQHLPWATTNGGHVNGSCEEEDKHDEDLKGSRVLKPMDDAPKTDKDQKVITAEPLPTQTTSEEDKQTDVQKELEEDPDEEYMGNERMIFNTDGDACYQGWGDSCTDPEDDLYGDDEDIVYNLGLDVTEILGLPEESKEDIPMKRKIRFSTAPIVVRAAATHDNIKLCRGKKEG